MKNFFKEYMSLTVPHKVFITALALVLLISTLGIVYETVLINILKEFCHL